MSWLERCVRIFARTPYSKSWRWKDIRFSLSLFHPSLWIVKSSKIATLRGTCANQFERRCEDCDYFGTRSTFLLPQSVDRSIVHLLTGDDSCHVVHSFHSDSPRVTVSSTCTCRRCLMTCLRRRLDNNQRIASLQKSFENDQYEIRICILSADTLHTGLLPSQWSETSLDMHSKLFISYSRLCQTSRFSLPFYYSNRFLHIHWPDPAVKWTASFRKLSSYWQTTTRRTNLFSFFLLDMRLSHNFCSSHVLRVTGKSSSYLFRQLTLHEQWNLSNIFARQSHISSVSHTWKRHRMYHEQYHTVFSSQTSTAKYTLQWSINSSFIMEESTAAREVWDTAHFGNKTSWFDWQRRFFFFFSELPNTLTSWESHSRKLCRRDRLRVVHLQHWTSWTGADTIDDTDVARNVTVVIDKDLVIWKTVLVLLSIWHTDWRHRTHARDNDDEISGVNSQKTG